MKMFVTSSASFPLIAFWRMEDLNVGFYLAGNTELRFKKDIKSSVFMLNMEVLGKKFEDTDEELFEFAVSVIDGVGGKRLRGIIGPILKSNYGIDCRHRRVWRGLYSQSAKRFFTPNYCETYQDDKAKIQL